MVKWYRKVAEAIKGFYCIAQVVTCSHRGLKLKNIWSLCKNGSVTPQCFNAMGEMT